MLLLEFNVQLVFVSKSSRKEAVGERVSPKPAHLIQEFLDGAQRSPSFLRQSFAYLRVSSSEVVPIQIRNMKEISECFTVSIHSINLHGVRPPPRLGEVPDDDVRGNLLEQSADPSL